MERDVVSIKDIEEVYGDKFEVVRALNESSSSKTITKEFLDDYIIVQVLNSVGPYKTLSVSGDVHQKFIMPASKVTKMRMLTPIEKFRPVLDKYYPNRWYHDEGRGIILFYYPELTLTNSIGMSHTVKDLVVYTVLTSSCSISGLVGKRYSFTKNELISHYSHSHLQKLNKSNGVWSNFCIGGGDTPFHKMLSSLNKVNVSTKEFELFLIQLEQFLTWESLEGKPFISMTKISSSRINNGMSEEYLTQEEEYDIARYIIRLTLDNPDREKIIVGGKHRLIDPNLDSNWYYDNIEKLVIEKYKDTALSNHLLEWDERNMCYVQNSSESVNLPYLDDSWDREIIRKFNITPRIIEEIDNTPIIRNKRIPKNIHSSLIRVVNLQMINGLFNNK